MNKSSIYLLFGWWISETENLFWKFFNASDMKDWSGLSHPIENRNHKLFWRFKITEVKDALRKEMGRATGPIEISIEV